MDTLTLKILKILIMNSYLFPDTKIRQMQQTKGTQNIQRKQVTYNGWIVFLLNASEKKVSEWL